jgi:type I restriction enzyme, S subunit
MLNIPAGNDSKNWPIVHFGDVVRNVDESVRDPQTSSLERYVGLEHIDPESLHIQRWGLISEGTSFTRRFRKGQLLFGKRRAYQRKVAVAEFDGLCSSDILVFEPKDDRLIPDLLPFLCQADGFFEHALDTSAGSLSPRTKFKDLAQYEFPLPPLDEQRRIAEILWAADTLIGKLDELFLNNQIYCQSVIDHFFSASIQKERKNNPNYKSDAWNLYKLHEVTTKIVDGVHKKPDYVPDGIPFITVENLTASSGISFENVRYITPEDHSEFFKRANPECGDVLVTKDGTLGVARFIDTDRVFSIFVSVALLKPRKDVLEGRFLELFFRTTDFRKHVSEKTSGSALKHIHLVDFRNTEFPLPNMDEQKYVVNVVKEIDTTSTEIDKHKKKSYNLKKELISRFFGQRK